MEEEDAFWMMCSIIEDLLPASYYSHTLIGIQVSTGKHVGNDKDIFDRDNYCISGVAGLECGRSWVRVQIWSSQRL
jgi:hypothetical protein